MGRPSDEELVAVVEKVARRLARIYQFSYYEVDDLIQHCYVEALEVLDKYDGERPLANFLAIHLRNRLHNLKRNKHARITTPCERCPLAAWNKANDSCKIYDFKEDCHLYYKWVVTNTDKKNISQPVNMGDHDVCHQADFDIAQFNDIYQRLRERLSAAGQQIMFKIMNGDRVRPNEIKALREEAEEILNG